MPLRLPPAQAAGSEITPEQVWLGRRRLLLGAAAGLATPGTVLAEPCARPDVPVPAGELPTPWEDVTGYNNYFEFSTDKKAVRHLAAEFPMDPWSVVVDGLVDTPRTWNLEDLLRRMPQEERVLRLRCVEGWSMLIPWTGFSLCNLLVRSQPRPEARYVVFTALLDSRRMPGQRSGTLEWPYVEGLAIEEAMHPLTTLVTGVYGKALPPQNGGPLRLAVPWKYGFKSIKAIVRITLAAHRPQTTWMKRAPGEYGFLANVNPDVPHPRWSQARELRLGDTRKRPTLFLNGYADQVAGLYAGVDLRASF